MDGNNHLFLSGAPLTVHNSTFGGTSVTVEAAKVDLAYSSFVDCNFVVEQGADLSVFLSTFSGNTSAEAKGPAIYLYSGTVAWFIPKH
jgi:hypothetical protein